MHIGLCGNPAVPYINGIGICCAVGDCAAKASVIHGSCKGELGKLFFGDYMDRTALCKPAVKCDCGCGRCSCCNGGYKASVADGGDAFIVNSPGYALWRICRQGVGIELRGLTDKQISVIEAEVKLRRRDFLRFIEIRNDVKTGDLHL